MGQFPLEPMIILRLKKKKKMIILRKYEPQNGLYYYTGHDTHSEVKS